VIFCDNPRAHTTTTIQFHDNTQERVRGKQGRDNFSRCSGTSGRKNKKLPIQKLLVRIDPHRMQEIRHDLK